MLGVRVDLGASGPDQDRAPRGGPRHPFVDPAPSQLRHGGYLQWRQPARRVRLDPVAQHEDAKHRHFVRDGACLRSLSRPVPLVCAPHSLTHLHSFLSQVNPYVSCSPGNPYADALVRALAASHSGQGRRSPPRDDPLARRNIAPQLRHLQLAVPALSPSPTPRSASTG